MVRPGRDRLTGTLEVDEPSGGGPDEGVRGRGIGRIRLRRVEDVSAESLLPFVQVAVTPGSVVHTDGWSGYAGLRSQGYEPRGTPRKRSGHPAHELMPRVHKVAALLSRWLLGTHHGGVQPSHCDYYRDEFPFRFNRRSSRARVALPSARAASGRDWSAALSPPGGPWSRGAGRRLTRAKWIRGLPVWSNL